jgi:hypothetical protein
MLMFFMLEPSHFAMTLPPMYFVLHCAYCFHSLENLFNMRDGLSQSPLSCIKLNWTARDAVEPVKDTRSFHAGSTGSASDNGGGMRASLRLFVGCLPIIITKFDYLYFPLIWLNLLRRKADKSFANVSHKKHNCGAIFY